MRTLFSIIMLALLVTSCVMPGDIDALKRNQSQYEEAVRSDLEELRSGTITREEYDRRQNETAAKFNEGIDAVVEDVKERTEAVASAVSSPITGNPAIDLLGGLLTMGAGTFFAVNKARDKKYVTAAPAHKDPTKAV